MSDKKVKATACDPCPAHPSYHGVGRPRGCLTCWWIWLCKQPIDVRNEQLADWLDSDRYWRDMHCEE